MLIQIAVGTAMILATTLVAAGFAWAGTALLVRAGAWLVRPPHDRKFVLVLVAVVLWIQAAVTVCVWLWALVFLGIGAFAALEPATYFAIVAFTTLGLGDLVLDQQWRILSGFAAANGLLLFGLYTAFLVEVMRRVRTEQMQGKADVE